MNFETISYVVDDKGIGRITLNRPKQLNALSIRMFEEMNELLPQIEQDSKVRCVVITGAERAFCSGGDLEEMHQGLGGIEGFYTYMQRANRFAAALAELNKPVIASVNGAATGAGMNIVLAADIAIASEKAKFSEIFGQVGLVPDIGGTYLLPRVVGRSKAKEIVMTYRMILAKEAEELGIVTRVVPVDELDAAVNELAERIARGPTFAFALGKKMINKAFEMDIHSALENEAMAQALAGNSEDHKEGVAAFFEKRKPVFKGR